MMKAWRLGIILCFGFFVFSAKALSDNAQSQEASQDDPQKKKIQDLGDKAISIFKSLESGDQKKVSFQKLFKEYFNVPAIAKYAFRGHWSEMSAEEKKKYVDLFEQDIVTTYFNLLEKYYQNDQFVVLSSSSSKDPSEKNFVVRSQIQRSNGQTIDVQWKMKKEKILDVIVGKVSTSSAKFNEYKEIFRKNGGTIADFLKGLEAKIQKISSKS